MELAPLPQSALFQKIPTRSIHENTFEKRSIVLNDFYQTSVPETELPGYSPRERMDLCYDWHRVREHVLLPLREGMDAKWQAFDFFHGLTAAGTYRLQEEHTVLPAASLVLLVGLFAASPKVEDLVDLTVLVDVPVDKCHRRTALREEPEFLAAWHSIWDEVEDFYFNEVRPVEAFDLVVENP